MSKVKSVHYIPILLIVLLFEGIIFQHLYSLGMISLNADNPALYFICQGLSKCLGAYAIALIFFNFLLQKSREKENRISNHKLFLHCFSYYPYVLFLTVFSLLVVCFLATDLNPNNTISYYLLFCFFSAMSVAGLLYSVIMYFTIGINSRRRHLEICRYVEKNIQKTDYTGLNEERQKAEVLKKRKYLDILLVNFISTFDDYSDDYIKIYSDSLYRIAGFTHSVQSGTEMLCLEKCDLMEIDTRIYPRDLNWYLPSRKSKIDYQELLTSECIHYNVYILSYLIRGVKSEDYWIDYCVQKINSFFTINDQIEFNIEIICLLYFQIFKRVNDRSNDPYDYKKADLINLRRFLHLICLGLPGSDRIFDVQTLYKVCFVITSISYALRLLQESNIVSLKQLVSDLFNGEAKQIIHFFEEEISYNSDRMDKFDINKVRSMKGVYDKIADITIMINCIDLNMSEIEYFELVHFQSKSSTRIFMDFKHIVTLL